MSGSRRSNPTGVRQLAIAELVVGDDFRLDDDPEALAELAASIAELGVLQPLVVRKATAGGWEVVAGRRRLAAARHAGYESVPCVVRVLDDDRAAEIALAENLHRRGLSPIEQGLAFAQMVERGRRQIEAAQHLRHVPLRTPHPVRHLDLGQGLRDRVHRREIGYETALDRMGRKEYKPRSSPSTHGKPLTGDDARLVSHWRRRHDRILAGVRAVLASYPTGDAHWRDLLERLLKLDLRPLDGEAEVA